MKRKKYTTLQWLVAALLMLFRCLLLTSWADDPFAAIAPLDTPAETTTEEPMLSGITAWQENLLLRKELYLLSGAALQELDEPRDLMTRASAGFEVQKRFATATRTIALIDYQGRMVYRNRMQDTYADAMGKHVSPWKYETHNAYVDFFSLWGDPGRVNLRVGNCYQPFGLNWQTDTHAALLHLANERVFGSVHDWQSTFYGELNQNFDYMLGYLAGAGHDQTWKNQSGMAVARVALNNEWLFQKGLEGGVSGVFGERVDKASVRRSPAVRTQARKGKVVKTWRAGADLRKRLDSNSGPFTLSGETALGEDESDLITVGLGQLEWLNPSRRWGSAIQYNHYWQERGTQSSNINESRVQTALTYYMRNDIGSANLHWIALAVERVVRSSDTPEDTLLMLQYYRYW